MRSFFVVMPTPDAADVIEMFFGNNDKLIEALELQRLDETLNVSPQVG